MNITRWTRQSSTPDPVLPPEPAATDAPGPELDWASLGVSAEPWPAMPASHDGPIEELTLGRAPAPSSGPAAGLAPAASPASPASRVASPAAAAPAATAGITPTQWDSTAAMPPRAAAAAQPDGMPAAATLRPVQAPPATAHPAAAAHPPAAAPGPATSGTQAATAAMSPAAAPQPRLGPAPAPSGTAPMTSASAPAAARQPGLPAPQPSAAHQAASAGILRPLQPGSPAPAAGSAQASQAPGHPQAVAAPVAHAAAPQVPAAPPAGAAPVAHAALAPAPLAPQPAAAASAQPVAQAQPATAPQPTPPAALGAQPPARPHVAAPPGQWAVATNTAIVSPRSATEVLATLAQKVAVGAVDQYQPVPLGFSPLDKTIGGGLRAGELLLIGGAQGTGKTTMAVQMARNIVLGGQASVLYICFEHDEEYLLNRVIALESALDNLPNKQAGVKLTDVRKEILGTWLAQGNASADLSANPRLRPALERINRYGENLYLLRGSQTTSTVENIRHLVERYKELSGERRLVVFIDYMQKVPVIPDPPTETEKVTYVVQGLKDVALAYDVPMISIVAADKEGLKAARLRNHHLRGSSAINYEADIIIILNEKYSIVSKVNIEFNPYQAQRFRDWVIMTVEKNRGGQNAVDLEYEKHFEFSCFDANGRTVQEKLIEERLYND